MLKICIKWLIKLISAQLPFPRAFAYFTKVNKLTECFYKILQILLIFLNFETVQTCRITSTHERYQRREALLVLTHTKRIAGIKKVLNISLVVQFIGLESVRLT